jgi:hypothetical protein
MTPMHSRRTPNSIAGVGASGGRKNYVIDPDIFFVGDVHETRNVSQ